MRKKIQPNRKRIKLYYNFPQDLELLCSGMLFGGLGDVWGGIVGISLVRRSGHVWEVFEGILKGL